MVTQNSTDELPDLNEMWINPAASHAAVEKIRKIICFWIMIAIERAGILTGSGKR